jgi:hypothetical protein
LELRASDSIELLESHNALWLVRWDDRLHEKFRTSTDGRMLGKFIPDMHMRKAPDGVRICCDDKAARQSRNQPRYQDNVAVIVVVLSVSRKLNV